jgi:subtilisin family serine protease/subtilase family serine protease
MRRIAFVAAVVAAFVVVLTLPVATQGRRNPRLETETRNGHEIVAREVLVRLRADSQAARGRLAALGDAQVTRIGRGPLYRVRSRSLNATALINQLQGQADVAYVEPNFVINAFSDPNDQSFPLLWGLENTGQPINFVPGVVDADIDATDAWDLTTGSTANVVAVIDTGVDYNHPDLAPNMWSAPAPFTVVIDGQSITCPAGSHGFNAIDHTCNPADDHDHGTHLSGTIGAAGNDVNGVVGVNWTTSIMAIKFLDSQGSGTMAGAVAAIDFAIQAKQAFPQLANVRVLNASWGDIEFSQALLDAILEANDHDMLLVAAAGNYGISNELLPMYPATYDAPNIISVAATTNTDERAFFSNYGPNTVHLGAPGKDIFSTTRNGGYAFLSGTSMAAPHVSGAAALVLSHCPLSTEQLKDALVGSVDANASLATTTISGGRLNVNSALHTCVAPPPAPASLSAASGDGMVTLTWPSAFGSTGYRVKRSLTAGGPYTVVADDHRSVVYVDTAVVNKTKYYYVVSAFNLVGESGDSSEASATPRGLSDLELLGFSTPYAIGTGTPFGVSTLTKSNGPGDADPSTIRFYLSTNLSVEPSDVRLDGSQPVPALAPGTSVTLSTQVSVPVGTLPGTYYLLAFADADNELPEKMEYNNIAGRIVQLGPDMVVAGFTVPSVVTPGTSISVSDTTRNQGADTTAPSTTRIYFSLDSALDPADTLLGSRGVGPLGAGLSSGGSTNITVPSPLGTGTYYLIASADDAKVVPETSETNNTVARAVQVGADLTVSAFTVPSLAGSSIDVSDTVTNGGTASLPSTVVKFYLSSDVSLDAGDTTLPQTRTVPALPAGASHTGPTTLTLPSNLTPGTYFIFAKADADNIVVETNEFNNTTARSTSVGGDLVITSFGAPSNVGVTFNVTDTTKNQGGAAIAASTVRFYYSTSPSFDSSATQLGATRAVPALVPGESHGGTTTLTLPTGLATRGYYLFAKADGANALPESNEQNNTSVRIISVGPDLVMQGLSSVGPVKAGHKAQIGDLLTNSGGADAGAFTVRFYLSTNFSLESTDIVLPGSRSVTSLAAGVTSSGSTQVTIPAGTAPGSYYLLVKCDADNTVAEVSEGNNTAARAIQVTH